MRNFQHLLFSIRIVHGGKKPIKTQIYEKIRQLIETEKLKEGDVLPASRLFAEKLGVGRITIMNAYRQLIDEGFLESKTGSRTLVSKNLSKGNTAPLTPNDGNRSIAKKLSWRGELAKKAYSYKPQEEIPLSVFAPDVDSLPGLMWTRIVARLSKSPWRHNNYCDAKGYYPCRKAIAEYLRRTRGIACDAEQVIMTSGIQQGITLCAQLLFDVGDSVAVEDPGYLPHLAALEFQGLKPVLLDSREGITGKSFDGISKSIRGALLAPSHCFPLGSSIPVQEQSKIVNCAEKEGFWIIENDYDGDLQFSDEFVPAMASINSSSVIHLGSFSKGIYPGFCVGYMVVPPDLSETFAGAKFLADKHVSEVHQTILTEFIAGGYYETHLRRLRKIYQQRRDALVTAVKENLSSFGELLPDDKGSHFVFILNSMFTDDVALSNYLRERCHIETRSLSVFYQEAPIQQGLILGCVHFKEEEITRAVERLKAGMENFLKNQIEMSKFPVQ